MRLAVFKSTESSVRVLVINYHSVIKYPHVGIDVLMCQGSANGRTYWKEPTGSDRSGGSNRSASWPRELSDRSAGLGVLKLRAKNGIRNLGGQRA